MTVFSLTVTSGVTPPTAKTTAKPLTGDARDGGDGECAARPSACPDPMESKMTMDLLDRPPPYDLEAEMCLLGSLLVRPGKFDVVRTIIGPQDFYSEANQRIYGHLLALHDEGKHADVMLLRARLQQAGDFDDVGGDAYLIELARAVPTATNAEEYARIVQEKALLRQMIWAATHVLRDAYSPDGAPLSIAAVAERLFAAIRRAADDSSIDRIPASGKITYHADREKGQDTDADRRAQPSHCRQRTDLSRAGASNGG